MYILFRNKNPHFFYNNFYLSLFWLKLLKLIFQQLFCLQKFKNLIDRKQAQKLIKQFVEFLSLISIKFIINNEKINIYIQNLPSNIKGIYADRDTANQNIFRFKKNKQYIHEQFSQNLISTLSSQK